MALSKRAKKIFADLSAGEIKFGEIKKLGKEIKKDHELAVELWSTGTFRPMLLSTLIFDKKLLTEEVIQQFAQDLATRDENERNQLSEWLLANQLMKDKNLVALITTWEKNDSPILRRLFWYHQARMRWTGNTPSGSAELLTSLEDNMGNEVQQVQWAMNFCAGWIGVFEPKLRPRCVKLGKNLGLYKDELVARNCTPSYLPEFINIEVSKRN